MKRIHKFPIQVTGTQTIQIQPNAEVVLVGLDPYNIPYIWALVDPTEPLHPYTLHVVGTGHPVPPDTSHLGSFVSDAYVWHLFS